MPRREPRAAHADERVAGRGGRHAGARRDQPRQDQDAPHSQGRLRRYKAIQDDTSARPTVFRQDHAVARPGRQARHYSKGPASCISLCLTSWLYSRQ